jgi:acetyl-CoA carboxylase biotin carboxyl carrier protein
MSGRQPANAVTANGAELAEVREHAVELLKKLGRQPSSLRIQVGDVAVDITWAPEPPRSDGHPGHPGDAGADEHEHPGDNGDVEVREYLTSPAVGVFYQAKEPGAEPFVSVGSLVQPGQQIGIVEAMKLMIPVEADRAGTITEVLKSNGSPVEYDEPLFAVETTEI